MGAFGRVARVECCQRINLSLNELYEAKRAKISKNLANLNWHLKPTQLDKKVINERRDRSVASIMPMSSIQGIPYMEPL